MSNTRQSEVTSQGATASPRLCFWISETQDPATHGGYVPSLIVENEAGHTPLLGNGTAAAPYVWGVTLAAAQAVCEAENARLGLTPRDALDIRISSMRASRAPTADQGGGRQSKIRITPGTAVTVGPVLAARVRWSRPDGDPAVESAVSIRPPGGHVSPHWRWSYWLNSEQAAHRAADHVSGVAEHDFQVIHDPARGQYAVLTDKHFSSLNPTWGSA